MRLLLFADIHTKYFSSVPFFNRKGKSNFSIELERAIKSMDFVIEQVKTLRPDFVIFLGDYFHNLNENQNILIIQAVKKMRELYDATQEVYSKLILMQGNHDLVGNDLSMMDILDADVIIKEPTKIDNMYFIPYYEPKMDMINKIKDVDRNEDVDYIFCHTEINGLKYNQVRYIENEVDIKNKKVYAGHIHLPQRHNNVVYVGSTYQNTISEYSNEHPHGVYFIDEENNKEYWIENTNVGYIKQLNIDRYEETSPEFFNKVDALKLKVSSDDNDYIKSVMDDIKSKYGIEYIWIEKNISKDNQPYIQEAISVDPKEAINLYIEKKYPDLKDELKQYI